MVIYEHGIQQRRDKILPHLEHKHTFADRLRGSADKCVLSKDIVNLNRSRPTDMRLVKQNYLPRDTNTGSSKHTDMTLKNLTLKNLILH